MVDTVEDMVVQVSSIRDGGPDPGTDIDKIDSANIKQVWGYVHIVMLSLIKMSCFCFLFTIVFVGYKLINIFSWLCDLSFNDVTCNDNVRYSTGSFAQLSILFCNNHYCRPCIIKILTIISSSSLSKPVILEPVQKMFIQKPHVWIILNTLKLIVTIKIFCWSKPAANDATWLTWYTRCLLVDIKHGILKIK